MPVQKDESGRRFVQAETVVPGTPEEVWNAIATGPGVSSWFVPTEVDGRVGGEVTANFGPGMDSLSTITDWDPPHRYVADSRDDMGDDGPTLATEWTVEARDGGTCVVRVVHSWFAETDDWDDQIGQHEYGWYAFFRILRVYMAHFQGRPSSVMQMMGFAPEPKETAWEALTTGLGLAGAQIGQTVATTSDAPRLAGIVEHVGPNEYPAELLLRVTEPMDGIAHLFAMPMGGMVWLPMRIFLYGDRVAEVAAREEPAWQEWMAARFAPGGE